MPGFPHRAALVLAALVLAITAIAISPGPASAGATERDIEIAADDLLAGLNTARLSDVPAAGGYDAPTLAIRTVADDATRADDVRHANDVLLSALQARSAGRFRLVANDVVRDLIDEIGAGAPDADTHQARVRSLRANLQPDILVVGTVRATAGGDILVYKAVGTETGVLLASAAPVPLDAPVYAAAPPVQAPVPLGKPLELEPQARATRPYDPGPGGTADIDPLPREPLQVTPSDYRATVYEAELLLHELGYAPGPVDGVMTSQTRAALRAYQTDSALPVNGRMTWVVVENMRRDMR